MLVYARHNGICRVGSGHSPTMPCSLGKVQYFLHVSGSTDVSSAPPPPFLLQCECYSFILFSFLSKLTVVSSARRRQAGGRASWWWLRACAAPVHPLCWRQLFLHRVALGNCFPQSVESLQIPVVYPWCGYSVYSWCSSVGKGFQDNGWWIASTRNMPVRLPVL